MTTFLGGHSAYAWCKSLCSLLLKQATELEHDVAFAELADALQLKGDLLAV